MNFFHMLKFIQELRTVAWINAYQKVEKSMTFLEEF